MKSVEELSAIYSVVASDYIGNKEIPVIKVTYGDKIKEPQSRLDVIGDEIDILIPMDYSDEDRVHIMFLKELGNLLVDDLGETGGGDEWDKLRSEIGAWDVALDANYGNNEIPLVDTDKLYSIRYSSLLSFTRALIKRNMLIVNEIMKDLDGGN